MMSCALRLCLERSIHGFEPSVRGVAGKPQNGLDQKPSEGFELLKAAATDVPGHNTKTMLAVKQPRQTEMAEPSQFSAWFEHDDRWPEGHWLLSRRAYHDRQALSQA
jgi:hypothetical protein